MRFIELLKDINPNWSIKEKVRYLYIAICKNILYDERFEYGKDTELLNSIYYRDINIEENEDPRLVCRTSNLVFKSLLDQLKIKSELIYKQSSVKRPIDVKDVALVFWDEDGKKYYANIVGDIQDCKYGAQTRYFGIGKNLYEEAQDVEVISAEDLKKIDENIGYVGKYYNDVIFKVLANEVKNTNNFKKFLRSQEIDTENLSRKEVLQYKLDYLTDLIKFRDKTAGPDEQKKFYKTLFSSSILDKFESKIFDALEFAKEDKDEIDVISVIVVNAEVSPIYFFYSEEEQTYLQISKEEVTEKVKGYKERKGKSLDQKDNNQQDLD